MARHEDLMLDAPFGKIAPRKAVRLDVQRILPAIHIAHRIDRPLNIRERIIFDHELVLFLQGRGMFKIGRNNLSFAPHVLFFVPPFVPHEIWSESSQPTEHVAIHFDFSQDLASASANPSRRRPYEVQLSHGLSIPQRIDLQPRDGIEEGCLRVVRSFAAIDPLAAVEASAALSDVLVRLMRLRSTAGAGNGTARIQVLVERAVAFIESHVADKLSADELSGHVGLSESHFNRAFRQQTGYAPMEYVRRFRVQRAKDQLGDLNLSVKEVAIRTGFDDAYHFSRVFRQIAGVPPTAYRDALFSRRT